jgi:uncharacterized phage protein gp47/JayE
MALSDYIKKQTKEGVLSGIVALLRLANFPVASWQPFSLPVHLTDAFASLYSDLSGLISDIAKGGFLDLAEKEWLDLLCKSLFNEDRKAAVAARHSVTLVDAASSGPHNYAAGTFWVANADGSLRFRNVDPVALGMGATAAYTFEAESPGEAYNVGVGSITQVLTPGGTGITASNPALSSGTSITQQGVDREKDPEYRQRCRDKWGTIGSGSNDAAYRYWCTSTSAEVSRVKITGDESTGQVLGWIAGPAGAVSSAALAAVQAVVEVKRPLCVGATISNVSGQTVSVIGTVFLATGANSSAVLSAVQVAIDAYARTVDIGGVVYVAELIAAIMGVDGVRNVTLSSPAADVYLASASVVAPVYSLSSAA